MNKKYTIAIFVIFSLIFGLIPCMSAETELGILPENLMIESLTSSPNSNTIFFVAGDMSGNAIYKGEISILLTGASYNKIADLPLGFAMYMEISPDGEHLAYVLANETGEYSVHKLKTDGTEHSLFYIAPNVVNELLISWIDNEYLITSEFEDTNDYPVTKISINNQGWSTAIEPNGYLAAALPYGNKIAYTKYALEEDVPPNHVYVKNSIDATGGPDNGDILISSNLFGQMHVFSKEWFGSSLYYIVDDWNDCEDGEPGTVRLDRDGQNIIQAELSPDSFSVTDDHQYIAFDKWNADESDSKKITITSSTGSIAKEYTATDDLLYSSPKWSYDNNYVLWVKSGMTGSSIMIDVAPNGVTIEPKPIYPVTNISHENVSENTIRLVWTHSLSETREKYYIYWNSGSGQVDYNNPLEIIADAQNVNFSKYITILNGVSYQFVIRTESNTGIEENNTNIYEVFKAEILPEPAKDFIGENIKNSAIVFNWTESPEASIYNIYSDNGTGSIDYTIPKWKISAPSFTYITESLTHAKKYKFGLRVENDLGVEEKNTGVSTEVTVFAYKDLIVDENLYRFELGNSLHYKFNDGDKSRLITHRVDGWNQAKMFPLSGVGAVVFYVAKGFENAVYGVIIRPDDINGATLEAVTPPPNENLYSVNLPGGYQVSWIDGVDAVEEGKSESVLDPLNKLRVLTGIEEKKLVLRLRVASANPGWEDNIEYYKFGENGFEGLHCLTHELKGYESYPFKNAVYEFYKPEDKVFYDYYSRRGKFVCLYRTNNENSCYCKVIDASDDEWNQKNWNITSELALPEGFSDEPTFHIEKLWSDEGVLLFRFRSSRYPRTVHYCAMNENEVYSLGAFFTDSLDLGPTENVYANFFSEELEGIYTPTGAEDPIKCTDFGPAKFLRINFSENGNQRIRYIDRYSYFDPDTIPPAATKHEFIDDRNINLFFNDALCYTSLQTGTLEVINNDLENTIAHTKELAMDGHTVLIGDLERELIKGVSYTIKLSDISDIFGNKTNITYNFVYNGGTLMPSEPLDFRASTLEEAKILLEWTEPEEKDNLEDYILYYGQEDVFENSVLISKDKTSYTTDSFTPEVYYTFLLRSRDDAKEEEKNDNRIRIFNSTNYSAYFKGYLFTSYRGNSRHIKCPDLNLEKEISKVDIPKRDQRWYIGQNYGVLFYKHGFKLYAATVDEKSIKGPYVVQDNFYSSNPLSHEFDSSAAASYSNDVKTLMGELDEFSNKIVGVFYLEDTFVVRLRINTPGFGINYRYFKITLDGISEISSGIRPDVHSKIKNDLYYPSQNNSQWFRENIEVIDDGILVRYWLDYSNGKDNLHYCIVTLDEINHLGGVLNTEFSEFLHNERYFPQNSDGRIQTIKEYTTFKNGILLSYCTQAYQTDCNKFSWIGKDVESIRKLGPYTFDAPITNIAESVVEEGEYENGSNKYLELKVNAGAPELTRVLVNQYGIYLDDGKYPRINEIECISKNEICVSFKKANVEISSSINSIDLSLDTENPEQYIIGTTVEIITNNEEKSYLTVRKIDFDTPKSIIVTVKENMYLETKYKIFLAGYKTLFGCEIPPETPEFGEFEGCHGDLYFNPCDSNVVRTNMKKIISDRYVTPINGEGNYLCNSFYLPRSGYWYATINHSTPNKDDYLNYSKVKINEEEIVFNQLYDIPQLPLSKITQKSSYPLIIYAEKGETSIRGYGKVNDAYCKDNFGGIRFTNEFPELSFGGYRYDVNNPLIPFVKDKNVYFHFKTNMPFKSIDCDKKTLFYKKTKTYDRDGNLVIDKDGNIVYHKESEYFTSNSSFQNNSYLNFWAVESVQWPPFDMETAPVETWIKGNAWKYVFNEIITDNPDVYWIGEKQIGGSVNSINNIRYIRHYPRSNAEIDDKFCIEFSNSFTPNDILLGTSRNQIAYTILDQIPIHFLVENKIIKIWPQKTTNNPHGLWNFNENYYVKIVSDNDNIDDHLNKKILTFTTKNYNNLFQLKSSSPKEGYEKCTKNQIFTLNFNYDIAEGQELNSIITIYKKDDGCKIESAAYIDPENKDKIIVFPVESFIENTEYEIRVSDELKNDDAVYIFEPAVLTFKTEEGDFRVKRCVPWTGEIFPYQRFTVQFTYQAASGYENYFKLFQKNSETDEYDISVNLKVEQDNNVKNIFHLQAIGAVPPKSKYRLYILAGIESVGGVALSSNRMFNFKSPRDYDQTEPDDHNNSSPSSQGCPIDLYSGSTIHAQTDIVIPSKPVPLAVGRKYSSARKNYLYGFGRGWESPIFDRVHLEKTLINANEIINGTTNETIEEVFAISGLTQLRNGSKIVKFYKISSDGSDAVEYPIIMINKDDYKTTAKVFEDDTILIEDSNLTKKYNSYGRLIKIIDKNEKYHEYLYDNEQQLIEIRDEAGQAIYFARDASNGLILQITSSTGHIVDYTYDRIGNLLSSDLSVNGISGTLSSGLYNYTYDEESRLTNIIWPDQTNESFEYNNDGRCSAWIKNDRRETIEYLPENVRKFTKPDLSFNYYYFNNNGRLERLEFSNGAVQEHNWNLSGLITSIIDPAGYTTDFRYNSSTLEMTGIVNCDGQTREFVYNESGKLVESIDLAGNSHTYEFDEKDNIVKETNPFNESTQYSYDVSGNLETITDSAGAETTMTVNSMGLPEEISDELGNTVKYSYDSFGNINSVSDAENNTTSIDYSWAGMIPGSESGGGSFLIECVTDALGNRTNFEYDESGNVIASKDALNNSTLMEYDELNRLVKVTYPDGAFEEREFDSMNHLVFSKDARGAEWRYEYNNAGKMTRLIYPDEREKLFEYDIRGQLIKTINPDGTSVEVTYDSLARPVEIMDANGISGAIQYNVLGNVTEVTDGLDNKKEYKYSKGLRVKEVIDALGYKNSFKYDSAGRMKKVIDAKGRNFNYRFDELSRVKKLVDAAKRIRKVLYDSKGNVKKEISPGNRTKKFVYDSLNRIKKIVYLNNSATGYSVQSSEAVEKTVAYEYDKLSRRISMVDHTGKTTYEYDCMSRLVKKIEPNGNIIEYSYDIGGVRKEMCVTISGGELLIWTYEHDILGRMTKQTTPDNETITYEYNNADRICRENYSNGVTGFYSYDNKGRTIRIEYRNNDGLLLDYRDYEYDLADNPIYEKSPEGEKQYYYDDKYQLVRTDYNMRSTRGKPLSSLLKGRGYILHSYDPVGNRTSEIKTLEFGFCKRGPQLYEKTAYSYDESDFLLKEEKFKGIRSGSNFKAQCRTGLITNNWDMDGNLISCKKKCGYSRHYKRDFFSYDAANNMIRSAMYGKKTYDYKYNGDNIRVTSAELKNNYFRNKRSSRYQSVTRYIQDGDETAAETDEDDDLLRYYTFGAGIDNLVAYTEVSKSNSCNWNGWSRWNRGRGRNHGNQSNRKTHFALKDALGSVTRLTDSSGRVSHRYFYSPFGKSTGFGSVPNNPFNYTGRRLDPSGLLFYRSRYMMPGVGRFMQADRWSGSAWSPWQSHPFIYVNNNPMVFVDPFGLWSWKHFGSGFLKGAGAGLAYGFASGSISAVAKIVAKAVPGFGSVILAYQIFNTAKAAFEISQMASQLSQIKMSDKQQSELVGNIVGGVIGSVIGGKAGKKVVNKYKSQIQSAIRNYVPDKYLEGGSLDLNAGNGNLNNAVNITKSSLKRLKIWIKKFSKPELPGLSQDKLDQLRRIAKKAGGRVEVHLEGIVGTGTRPHAHVYDLGKKIGSRHIWLHEGVK